MTAYLAIKMLHIMSAAILFGTGLGIAFFMLRAYLTGNQQTMLATTKIVVLADWLFTAPAVIVQLLTGFWLVHKTGISLQSDWFRLSIGLFLLVGMCWLPVVWIQIRIHKLAEQDFASVVYHRLMKIWISLGIVAFTAMLGIFYLMVFKPGL